METIERGEYRTRYTIDAQGLTFVVHAASLKELREKVREMLKPGVAWRVVTVGLEQRRLCAPATKERTKR